ncbi:NUDIX hydrolase [Ornithinibacillus californiensis]|uniref:NUDIX hydrolase n=1 Tax=Ornithinibacillus californiensis TaxID=161536 RepID=UPI000A4F15E7|nr:NUDIX hydrolase [Ornithinibacillus californiensis]
MSGERKYHRAFGVYGIYQEGNRLLVINKGGGPYKNRFDLPGGSLEEGESLSDAMVREFKEETGLDIEIVEQIGVTDFLFPSNWRDFTDVHHIAVFYIVKKIGGEITVPEAFEGQDSLGAEWVTSQDVSEDNASPLVMKALEWLETKTLGLHVNRDEEWIVKE